MSNGKTAHWKVHWTHLRPIAETLYEHNASLDLMPWAEQHWPILAESGLGCAATETNQLDSMVRGVSLCHLHFQVIHVCHLEVFCPDYADPLSRFFDIEDVAALAIEHYLDADARSGFPRHCLDCALRGIVPKQSLACFAALKDHYGSIEAIFDSMAEYVAIDLDNPSRDELQGFVNASHLLQQFDRDSRSMIAH